ncbi:MAG TPA: DUF6134 family protein [Alphaproteobacteria bacterium]|nr:DUF6134 family protein [Alphaproteobacteria bacterium]
MIRAIRQPLAALALMAAGVTAAEATPLPPNLSFDVVRGGESIGTHKVEFRRDGDNLTVDIAIDLTVRLAFIPVFRYTHRNTEVWRDGKLVRLDSTTDDDGTKYRVSAEATAEGLKVTDAEGRSYIAPPDTVPTSYWNAALLERNELLNTQDGTLMPISVESRQGSADGATHFHLIKGEDATPIDVWYDARGKNWSKLRFIARGSTIDYRRLAPSQQQAFD